MGSGCPRGLPRRFARFGLPDGAFLASPAAALEMHCRRGESLLHRSAAAGTCGRTVSVHTVPDLEFVAAVLAEVVVEGHRVSGIWSAAQHSHAALGTVEGSIVARGEPAVGTRNRTRVAGRQGSLDGHRANGVPVGDDVREQTGQQVGGIAVGVAPHSLAAPTHHRPDDHVAGDLVQCDTTPPTIAL